MQSGISNEILEKAPLILGEVQKAKSILLHCHPGPDPDSVGSALAMKFALEQLGKKVTVIRGDSDIPEAFMHFPGAQDIAKKNFFEVDLNEFELFIAQDAGSIEMISRKGAVEFSPSLKVVVIDHHRTNTKYGSINLVDSSYPATAQMLFDVFSVWNIKITPEIAKNIFIGMYTDTGGFKYEGTSPRTFEIVSHLMTIAPDMLKMVSVMENSDTPGFIAFKGLAFSAVQEFCDGKMALSLVSHDMIMKDSRITDEISSSPISASLRLVKKWGIVGTLVEFEPNVIKISFRTNKADVYDLTKLVIAFGGGGHKAAAGATLLMSLEEARDLVVSKAKELYNL